ncbi:MAG: LSM domain-containing protein [Nitrososphaerota archaeon]
MSNEFGVKPLTLIKKYIDKPIKVTLKNEVAYSGVMLETDNYMNLVLEKATEFYNNDRRANYPYILIRGNNIMYIQLEYSE